MKKNYPKNIKEINKLIESDYDREQIKIVSTSWFPLMKYDEKYDNAKSFEAIQYLVLGLNPSLTNKFSEHIHSTIFKIKDQFDPKSNHDFGRKTIYQNNEENFTKKLVDYQAKLKYDEKEQIAYFTQLEKFFNDFENNTSFKENVFHYDFCQLRHTDSNKIKKIIQNNYKILIKHFESIIDIAQPKMIFIFNATLVKLLKDNNYFTSNNLDPELGCYFYKNIPAILANQLSGGATSSVYRELLIWNVNRIINKKIL